MRDRSRAAGRRPPWRIGIVPVDHYENFPVASLLCPARAAPGDRGDLRLRPHRRRHRRRRRRARRASGWPRWPPTAPTLAATAARPARPRRWPQVFEPLARGDRAPPPAGRRCSTTCSTPSSQDVTVHALRRPRRRCSTTAAARPTRSAGCCCICTASATPSALAPLRRDLQRPAARSTSGRTWASTRARGRLYLPRGRLPPPRRRSARAARRHGQRRGPRAWSPRPSPGRAS